MEFGHTILMELKNSWKGYLIFVLVVVLLIGGFTQAYPAFNEAFEDDLEGAEDVEIDLIEEDDRVLVKLSWMEVENAENYTLLVGSNRHMIVPVDRVEGIEDSRYEYHLPSDEDGGIPETYFAVVAVIGPEDTQYVGMETTVERRTPIEELWGMDYGDIQAFVSVLWNMWWFLLIGLYIGYISVTGVSKDYEEGRMDILLSKPISRRQYLLEKFTLLAFYTLFLLMVAGSTLIVSVYSVGELGSVGSSALFLSAVLSWPVFLVIIAVSLLSAVHLEKSNKAVGLSFIFILIQFGIHLVGDISDSLEHVKPYTIISYWDHKAILYGEAIGMADIAFILIVAILLVILAVRIFEKKDLPT